MKNNLPPYIVYLIVCIVYGVFSYNPLAAQSACGCDHVLKATDNYVDGSRMDVKPGDVICLQAGTYKFLNLFNFQGSAEKPLTFINCGGQVIIGKNQHYYGIVLNNVNHYRFTGTGDAAYTYGIKVDGVTGSGSGLAGYGSYAEVDHVEISHTGFAGILFKRDPSCDAGSWSENFVMRQVSFHDNYIHDTHGEGIYLGYTGGPKKLSCNGGEKTVYPHNLEGVRVYNNRIEHTGWDGIQVSRAVSDCQIYNNTVKDYGTSGTRYQQVGIVIGGGTTGRLYNNHIEQGTGGGIHVFGAGGNYVYNNVIADAGEDGIFCDDRETVSGRGYYFINNTIVRAADAGMKMYSDESKGNVFYNNLIAGAKGKQAVVVLHKGIDWLAEHNLIVTDVEAVKFAAGSYGLQSGSPAVDKGKQVSSYGVETDCIGRERPQGAGFDIGAYELAEERQDSYEQNGLHYRYYQGSWDRLPDFSSLTATTEGRVENFSLSPRLQDDDFGLVYQGYIQVAQRGSYTFYISSDDGSRLYIHDKLLVDNDGLHARQERSASITLDAGLHPIKLAFFEKKGGNQLSVSYALEGSFSKTAVPDEVLFTDAVPVNTSPEIQPIAAFQLEEGLQKKLTIKAIDPDTEDQLTWSYDNLPAFMQVSSQDDQLVITGNPGYEDAGEYEGTLRVSDGNGGVDSVILNISVDNIEINTNIHYAYYEGTWRKLPDFNDLSPVKTGKTSNFDMSARDRDDQFAFLFTGYLDIPVSGSYTFETQSDDGSRLYINDTLVVDNDGLHGLRYAEGTVALQKGVYPIWVSFFEAGGEETLNVFWKNTAHGVANREKIPAVAFVDKPEELPTPTPVQPLPDVYVNFNLCCDVVSQPWNNTHLVIANPRDVLEDLVDEDGEKTSLKLEFVTQTGSTAYNASGTVTGQNNGIVPDAVSKTAFWTTDQATFKLAGLDPNYQYSLTFFGSRNGSGDRTTAYTANNKTASLNAANNTDQVAVLENLIPGTDNTISFTLSKAAGSSYGYLNALIIKAVPRTATATSRALVTTEAKFKISVAYPNPFSDHINVGFEALEDSKTDIQIYDKMGVIYKTLKGLVIKKGSSTVTIDTRREISKPGIYILKITSGAITYEEILVKE